MPADDAETLRVWVLIPIYDHGSTIGDVVAELVEIGLPCLIVDDGSAGATRAVLDGLAERYPWVVLERLAVNRGKGFALQHGFRVARAAGATHVIHLDADGQHCLPDVRRFVDLLEDDPEVAVFGSPVFDASVPRRRLYARQLSRWIVWLCTLSFAIDDPLCGFRALPLERTLQVLDRESLGNHMEMEPGLAVVLVWAGVRAVSLPTRVRYLPGGLSHFDAVADTLRLAGLYLRLVVRMLPRIPRLLARSSAPAVD